MMTVLSPVSPDDDAAAVLAGLVDDGSLGESPINATSLCSASTSTGASGGDDDDDERRGRQTAGRKWWSSSPTRHVVLRPMGGDLRLRAQWKLTWQLTRIDEC